VTIRRPDCRPSPRTAVAHSALLAVPLLLWCAPARAEWPFEVAPMSRPAESPEEDIIPGEFIVRLRTGVGVGLRVAGGEFREGPEGLLHHLRAASIGHVRPALRTTPARAVGPAARLRSAYAIRSSSTLAELRESLEDDQYVESVEPLSRYRALAEPNDTWFKFQGDLMDLRLPEVREIGDGTGVIVAVVDSGVTPNGADGFNNLLVGWDFIGDDDDASDDDAMVSGLAHGTHVAGTIAQRTDNLEGVAGIAQGVSILPVRVMHYDEASGSVWGDSADIADGIIWATDHGAYVINLSIGSTVRSDLVADACAYAYESGVFLAGSSGNNGALEGVLYPAALPSVFAVGAVGRSHEVTSYSNQGQNLALVAPGGEASEDRDGDGHDDGVVQESVTMNGWRYVFAQGTSMASPHVAAAAALLVQRGWVRPEAIAEVLIQTADDLGTPGFDTVTGFGELNLLAALALPVDESQLSQSGAVVISNVHTDYAEDGRAWLSWNTDVAATTEASGEGVSEADLLPTHLHSVFVKAEPGSTPLVTLVSRTPTSEAQQSLTLEFPYPSDSIFAGCNDSGAGALLLFPGVALAGGLRRRRQPH
jgi:subtilisin family serine protease